MTDTSHSSAQSDTFPAGAPEDSAEADRPERDAPAAGAASAESTFDETATDDSGTEESGTDELAPAGSGRSTRTPLERLEREGEIAADYLESLLDLADLDGDLDVDIDGDRAAVSIVDSEEGRVPRRLVGRDGEVLEALQELARLAVLAATGERSRLMLDVAGHRAARREALVARAREAVAQVRANGERLALEAMSPFERKVVHDAVAEQGLATESEGVEPHRHVVVLPA